MRPEAGDWLWGVQALSAMETRYLQILKSPNRGRRCIPPIRSSAFGIAPGSNSAHFDSGRPVEH
jgi:hypothetical protein